MEPKNTKYTELQHSCLSILFKIQEIIRQYNRLATIEKIEEILIKVNM